jgi:LPXTG-motif cell wall-anchored protein
MKPSGKFPKTFFLALTLALFSQSHLFACAACGSDNGHIDSPLTGGMNWGIFTLMGVIVTVLVSIATFFVFIIRKEAALAAKTAAENFSEVKI